MRQSKEPRGAGLAEKLLAGERVWTHRYPYMAFLAAFLSVVSIALAVLLWSIHTSSMSAQDESGRTDVAGIVFGYVFTAVWTSLAAYTCGTFVFWSLQFSATSLRCWNWRGRVHAVRFSDIIGAVCYGRSSSGVIFWWTEICHADPSARGGFRWKSVVRGTTKLTASAVLDELVRRSELSASGPLANWPGRIAVWRRAGSDSDIPRRRFSWLMIGIQRPA